MHEVLVNRLGGLSLPRKSVVRLTDRPDMTLDVYRGRKTTMQQQNATFKDFSIFSSGGHLVYRSGAILAILVGSHLGNIPMKFESQWPKGSIGVTCSFKKKIIHDFLFLALAAILFIGAEPF